MDDLEFPPVLGAIHSMFMFIMALIMFGLAVAQVIKEGVGAELRDESGLRAAIREARSWRVGIATIFGLSTLAKSQLR
jgi:hypothetical protein